MIISNLKIYYLIKKNKIKNFSKNKLFSKKKSNIIFILGSGNSINELNDTNWNEIKKNDSLGINRWYLHKHVPNFLLFEGAKKSDLKAEGGKEKNNFTYQVLNDSSERYKDSLFLIKDLDSLYINFNKLNLLKDRIMPIYKLIPPGKTIESIKKSFSIIRNLGLAKSFSYPIGYRASISHAISLAINMGYEKIILCGIDLRGPYFWSKKLMI